MTAKFLPPMKLFCINPTSASVAVLVVVVILRYNSICSTQSLGKSNTNPPPLRFLTMRFEFTFESAFGSGFEFQVERLVQPVLR